MKHLLAICSSALIALSACFFGSTSTKVETAEIPFDSYQYTIQDVCNLQDFLLTRPTKENLTGKPYDMNSDDRWDVIDLCLMKREVLKTMTTEPENDTLVVYFSRTGNTEKIAEYLIELTDADSYVIKAAVPYTDDDIKETLNKSTVEKANQ